MPEEAPETEKLKTENIVGNDRLPCFGVLRMRSRVLLGGTQKLLFCSIITVEYLLVIF